MQRDAYGVMIRRAAKLAFPATVKQIDGSILHEKIFNESFEGYKARRIVLMTHMEGSGENVLQCVLKCLEDEKKYFACKDALVRAKVNGVSGGAMSMHLPNSVEGPPTDSAATTAPFPPSTQSARDSDRIPLDVYGISDKGMITRVDVTKAMLQQQQRQNGGGTSLHAMRRKRVKGDKPFQFEGELWSGRAVPLPAVSPRVVEEQLRKEREKKAMHDEAAPPSSSSSSSPSSSSSSSSSLPYLPKDLVISDFEAFQKHYYPHFMYKLVPLMCTDMPTFECMQAICNIENAPFRIDWRREPVSIKHGWVSPRSPVREEVWKYFEPRMTAAELAVPKDIRKFPCGNSIEWDGMLLTRPEHCSKTNFGYAGLLQMRQGISSSALDEFGHQLDFFQSTHFRELIANKTPLMAELYACEKRYFFLGSATPLDRSLREKALRLGAEKGFMVMEQRNGEFQLVR